MEKEVLIGYLCFDLSDRNDIEELDRLKKEIDILFIMKGVLK